MSSHGSRPGDEYPIADLYGLLLDAWNRRDADAYAALFEEDGDVVGFDGSMMNGRAEIGSTLRKIFADHETATYVSKIRGVRSPGPDVAILRAVAGMVPRGKHELNPAVHAIQTLVAVSHGGEWRIALFQNTPAQFHGRPELAQALTEELQALVRQAVR